MLCRLLTSCTVLLITFQLPAQQRWLRGIAGTGKEEALAISVTAQQDVYTAGYFTTPLTIENDVRQTNGGSDILLVKQNAAGGFIWSRSAGGSGMDRALAVKSLPDGGTIITGFYTGQAVFDTIGITAVNQSQDVFLARYSPGGDVRWVKTFGGGASDQGTALWVDAGGHITVCGYYSGTMQMGSIILESLPDTNGLPSQDGFIARLDSSGNVLWAKSIGGRYADRAQAIALDLAGNTYLAGQFSDTLRTTGAVYPNTAFNAGFLVKFDPAGAPVWMQRFLGAQVKMNCLDYRNGVLSVAGDFSGTLTVAGSSNRVFPGEYQRNIFLLNMNDAGTILHSATLSSENALSVKGLTVDTEGNAYLAGEFRCQLTSLNRHAPGWFYSRGYRDIFLLKYNTAAQLIWKQQFGGRKDDLVYGIAGSGKDDPVLAGSYELNFIIPYPAGFVSYPPLNSYSGFSDMVLCTDSSYNTGAVLNGRGQRDWFITRPVDTKRLPPTIFNGQLDSTTCTADSASFYITAGSTSDSVQYQRFGKDTVSFCNVITLRHVSEFVNDISNRLPESSLRWGNGSANAAVATQASGWFTLTKSRLDGCSSYTDSIFLDRQAVPPLSDITSPGLTVYPAASPDGACQRYLYYSPGTQPQIVGNGTSTVALPGYWISGTDTFSGNPLTVTQPGTYVYTQTSPDSQCMNSRCIRVLPAQEMACDSLRNPIDSLDAVLTLVDDGRHPHPEKRGDTLIICSLSRFMMEVVDGSLRSSQTGHSIQRIVRWSKTGPLIFSSSGSQTYRYTAEYHTMLFDIYDPGTTASVIAEILEPTGEVFQTLRWDFHIVRVASPPPPVISHHPGRVCPGDTAQVIISATDSIIVYRNVGNIIVAKGIGQLIVPVTPPQSFDIYTVRKNEEYGCVKRSNAVQIEIQPRSPVQILSSPANAIVCPGQPVLLRVANATDAVWAGPFTTAPPTGNEIEVTIPGEYYVTATDLSGCRQGSASFTVDAYSTPSISVDNALICKGESTTLRVDVSPGTQIQWLPPLSGSSLTRSVNRGGLYQVRTTGCGITTNLQVQVLESNAPVAAIRPPASGNLCEGQTIRLDAVEGPYDYLWLPMLESGPELSVSTGGLYILEVTDLNFCTDRDSLHLTRIPAPASPVPGNGSAVCPGDSITFTASSAYPVHWYRLPDAPSFHTGNDLTVDSVLETDFFFAASHNPENGCYSAQTLFIPRFRPHVQIEEVMGDTSLCSGDTLHLNANAGMPFTGNFYWTGPDSTSSEGQHLHLADVSPQHAGRYLLVATADSSTCGTDTFSVKVSINSPPEIMLLFRDTTVCEGSSIDLLTDDQPETMYTWMLADGTTLSGNPARIPATDTTQSGMIRLLADQKGCFSRDSILMKVVASPPDPSILVTGSPCPGMSMMLTGPVAVQPSFSHHWILPDGSSQSTESIELVPLTEAMNGTYTLFIRSGNCDSGPAFYTVNISAGPAVSWPPVIQLCPFDTVLISGPEGMISYQWNNGNTGMANAVFSPDSIRLETTDTNGCKFSYYSVSVSGSCEVPGIPNSFTPNGDGYNDTWKWTIKEAGNIHLSIFNRWGVLVASMKQKDILWEGFSADGKQLPSATYFYVAEIRLPDGSSRSIKGFVELVR